MSHSDLPMDVEFLLGQVGGSKSTAGLVIDEFVNQVPLDLENMGNLLQSGDLLSVGKVAHSVKGTSGVFGAHLLRQHASDLEMAAKGGDVEKTTELFPLFAEEVKRCLDFIPQLRASLA